jgi:hypothetical protein
MSKSASQLYDKTGAAFSFDHEHDGTAYVRPMVKVFLQSGYGEDVHEEEDFEPAGYLVAMDRSSLFDAPPLAVVNDEVAAKQAELDALKAEANKVVRDINSQRSAAERGLQEAKRQLDQWMESHRVMTDLGKLLDGQVLYPLSVSENHYHRARDIPSIPSMQNAAYLAITSGNFEKGQKWVCKKYADDTYRTPFRFFDTEEERAEVILSEFEATCAKFRERPNFDTTSHTATTTLHYGTLMEWVEMHPTLTIPDDIKAMKAANDAELVERRKATLAAELAAISKAGADMGERV